MTTKLFSRRLPLASTQIFRQYRCPKNYPRHVTTLREVCSYSKYCESRFLQPNYLNYTTVSYFSSNQTPKEKVVKNEKEEECEKKPSLLKRFKSMYRDYWYVLLPVHIVTSIGWFSGFYYMAKR